MQSPAPMQNGASYGIPMNNNFGGSNGSSLGSGGNDMMGPGPVGFGGNFSNNGPIPHQQQQQQPHNFNIMPNGGPPGMMNPHANMISPQLQLLPGQMPSQSQQDIMMQQQQRGNMMMDPIMQNGIQRGPMPHSNTPSVPSPHPKQPQYPHPGISPLPSNQQPSPHPNQPPYPQPGISPLPNQPPMNMNNPHSRVMSPMSQPGPGMMSPHHQMMNQSLPMGNPHHRPPSQSGMVPPPGHLPPGMQQQGNGHPPMPPGMMGNRIAQGMPPGMIPIGGPHPGVPPNPHAGMMSPHGGIPPPNMMMNPHHHPPNMIVPPGSKIYPPNQPMVFNPQNPNAPPIYPCGVCHREVQGDSDEAIMCESGCNFWFHRSCVNMSPEAYVYLKKEIYVEWCCDNCFRTKGIAPIKIKN